jgi:hypothetical protein
MHRRAPNTAQRSRYQNNLSLFHVCRKAHKLVSREGNHFSALNFLQRSFVNFEILALPAADMVRLRLTPLALTSFELTGAGCEPFSAKIAP